MKNKIDIVLFGENGVIFDVTIKGRSFGMHVSDDMFRRKCLYIKEKPITRENIKVSSILNIVEGALRDMKLSVSLTRENTVVSIVDGKTRKTIE